MDMSVCLYCYLQTTWCPFFWLHVFLTLPSLRVFSGLPLSINSDSVVGSECLEREPPKPYPSCSSIDPSCRFPLGYQDASPSVGIPLQQRFQHLSYSQYQGGGSVSPIPDVFEVPISAALAALTDFLPGSQPLCSLCTGTWAVGGRIQHRPCMLCTSGNAHVNKLAWAVAWAKRLWELRQKGMQTHLR